MICPKCSCWVAPPSKQCTHCGWVAPVAQSPAPSRATPYIEPPVPPSVPLMPSVIEPKRASGFTVALPWALCGLLGTALVIVVFLMQQSPPPPQSAALVPSIPSPPVQAAVATQAPIIQAPVSPPVRTGPSFTEIDSKMDGRLYRWTEAQKEAYWNTVVGTQINWTGEVAEVSAQNNGTISLKCNPQTLGIDVSVTLDGSQLEKLASISRGARVSITGNIEGHGMMGYTIVQGHIDGL